MSSARPRRRPSRTRARRRRWRAGRHVEPAPLQIEQQIAPVLGTFAGAIGEADQLLAAFRRRADQHEDALLLVFEPGLQMDAVGPDVDVPPGRQIALLPAVCSSCQPSFRRPMADAESPAASLPSKAASASEKSPVEMPLR